MRYYSLSQAQKRIWYEQKKYKYSSMFNIGGTVQINGNAELSILKQAIMAVYDQNTAMRLRLQEDHTDINQISGYEIRQYISEEVIEVEEKDFSGEANPLEALMVWCDEQAGIPFGMEHAPLCYFTVYRLSEECTGYFIKMHHIISDGWSVKLLTDQIAQMYSCLKEQKSLHIPQRTSYLTIIDKENQYLNSPSFYDDKQFWASKFTLLQESRKNSEMPEGRRKIFLLDKAIQKDINNYIEKNHFSLNLFFIGIYIISEYKKCKEKEIVVGIPFFGRSGKEEKQVFGNFTNTMPYMYRVNNNKTVHNIFMEIKADIDECLRHRKYPYNILHQDLSLTERGMGCIYQTCINYYNTTICTNINGMPAVNQEFYNGQQDYPLQIIIRHWNDMRLQLDFDYQKELYQKEQIDQLYFQLMTLAEQIIKNDSISISNIQLLSEADQTEFLYTYNDTGKTYPDKTVIDLFTQQVKLMPEQNAVSCAEQEITYKFLEELSGAAAGKLKEHGVRKGDTVALIPEYKAESIALVLSIWKCGAVYLPIDKNLPEERKKRILENADARFLVAEESTAFFYECRLGYDQMFTCNHLEVESNLSIPEDIAYLLYTSGSSGDPKGVMVSHKSLMNYLWWACKTYLRQQEEVFPLFSSFAFDFTLTSLLLPLISGNEIRIYNPSEENNVFRKIRHDNRATILKITPSHIAMMKEMDWKDSRIHTIIAGGEDLKREACEELCQFFEKKIIIYNEYGPTEATIGCMIYAYQGNETEASVPIGYPISNMQVYLLDQELRPLPNNVVGELYIGGDGLAAGYHRADKENKDRFLDNPFKTEGKIYRTGDLAYRNQCGDMVYYGRNDRQIKIHGHRIDLIEIEKHIMNSGLVSEVYVKAENTGKQSRILCAYLTRVPKYNEVKLKQYLERFLPGYMVPEFYTVLAQFPLTVNGKVDENKLVLPETDVVNIRNTYEEEYLIFIETLADLFPESLLAPGSNFFRMGGDSIKAILLSSRLQEKGFELRVSDILSNPTLHMMAGKITKTQGVSYDQGIIEGNIKSIPIIQWFLGKEYAMEGHYNLSVLLEWKQEMAIDILENIFQKLIQYHDGLRINLRNKDRSLFYNNSHLKEKCIIRVIEEDQGNVSLQEIIEKKADKYFDLYKDLLIRPYVIKTSGITYLYIIMHHMISDGISMRILLEDLGKLWTHYKNSVNYLLPEKTISYKAYAELYSKDIQLGVQQINSGYGQYECKYGETFVESVELSREYTEKATGDALSAYGLKTEGLVVSALARTWHKFTGCEAVTIDMEGHGRNVMKAVNLSRTIGWFTEVYPVLLSISESDLAGQMLALAEQLKKGTEGAGEAGGACMFRVNYLGEIGELNNLFFKVMSIVNNEDVSPENRFEYIADINIYIQDRKLKTVIRLGKIKNEIKLKFARNLIQELQAIIDQCCSLKKRIYTPSDFRLVNMSQNELDTLLQ